MRRDSSPGNPLRANRSEQFSVQRMIQFYQMLPKEQKKQIVNAVSDALPRPVRRKLAKHKTDDLKINILIHDPVLREKLADSAYKLIQNRIPLDPKEITNVQTIADAMTEENKFDYTILYYKWAYELSNNGLQYYLLTFSYFAQSELLDSILNDRPLPETDRLAMAESLRTLLAETKADAAEAPAEEEAQEPSEEPEAVEQQTTAEQEIILEQEITPEPELAPEQEITPEPIAESESAEQQITAEPEITPEPEAASEPEITPEPIAESETAEPQTIAEPEITPEPEVASEPEMIPEPIAEPELTEPQTIAEPEITPEPEATPEQEITPEPIAEPESTQQEIIHEPEKTVQTPAPAANPSPQRKQLLLLGRLEKRNTYFNFFPAYDLSTGHVNQIPYYKLAIDYPAKGGLNLYYSSYYGAAREFMEAHSDSGTDISASHLHVLSFYPDELESNENSDYQVRLDLDQCCRRGRRVNDILRDPAEFHIYKYVTSEEVNLSRKDLTSHVIFVNEDCLLDGEQVLLRHHGQIYGPFPVHFRAIDGRFYIRTNADEKHYLLPCYEPSSVIPVELEKQAYAEEPFFTQCAQLTEPPQMLDLITDEMLLNALSESRISMETALKSPQDFSAACAKSPFFWDVPAEIRASRLARLQGIAARTQQFRDTQQAVFQELLQQNQAGSAPLSDTMVQESDAYRRLLSERDAERQKNYSNEKKIQQLEQLLEEQRLHSETGIQSGLFGQGTDRLTEIIRELAQLREQSALYAETESLKQERERLRITNDYLRECEGRYRAQMFTAQQEVSTAIRSGFEHPAQLAFEPYIANAMMKAAAEWDASHEAESYAERSKAFLEYTPAAEQGSALIDRIVAYLQARRNYSRNTIINICISLAQSFLTVFAGEPGIGKTSICGLMAEALGMNSFPELNEGRYAAISVERGWTSKRDLIGYFNPLTKQYDKNNSKLYDALRILHEEGSSSAFPYLILLDEANLSPIEYYWADFMRLADRSTDASAYINIGTEQDLFIPQTLRFAATVNSDQTTEPLSPRLLDRAAVIRLPDTALKPEELIPQPEQLPPVSWEHFQAAFCGGSDLLPSTQRMLDSIYSLFRDYGMQVSPRIRLAIEKYIRTAQDIMAPEPNVLPVEKATDYAVMQKLLPKINGYYANYERFFESLKALCKEHHLMMTAEACERMEQAQERNMGYCQYLC